MFTRLLVATLLGSSALMLTPAAAQHPGHPRPAAPAVRPPMAAPHVQAPRMPAPHFSAPPRAAPSFRPAAPIHAAPHFAPSFRPAAPAHAAPHFAPSFRPAHAAPHFAPRPAAPAHAMPRPGVVPRTAPQVARPRPPANRPSAPAGIGHPPGAGQPAALNRLQARQLRREENAQIRQLRVQQRQQLHDLRAHGPRPDRNALQQLRAQHQQQLHDMRQQFRDRRLGLHRPPQIGALRPNGKPRMTPELVRQGRFASHFLHHPHPPHWRADRIPAHLAWRRHHHAGFVAWSGPLFWPYAYTDLFYYPFWPDAYDNSYWPSVYDDFFDSIYWSTGNPYSGSPYAAPTAVSVTQQATSSRRRQAAIGVCGSSAGITAWPFARIESLLKPTAEQQAILEELKAAAAQAADGLKASCPQEAALTPTGRLAVMIARLQATLDASRAVHLPLMRFYDALTDEQKARFNALGPNAGPKAEIAETSDDNACSGQKPGLTDLPIERIEDAVKPSEAQAAGLDRLSKANEQAVAILQAACPDSVPQTPVGRFEAIEKRLDAMIQAAKAVQPALQEFYGSLTDEQKSRFNTLGDQAQQ